MYAFVIHPLPLHCVLSERPIHRRRTSVNLIISPLVKHSFLLSSSTVFMFSIHTASTGPSKRYHFLSDVELELPSRIIDDRIPSVLSVVNIKYENMMASCCVTDMPQQFKRTRTIYYMDMPLFYLITIRESLNQTLRKVDPWLWISDSIRMCGLPRTAFPQETFDLLMKSSLSSELRSTMNFTKIRVINGGLVLMENSRKQPLSQVLLMTRYLKKVHNGTSVVKYWFNVY